MQTGIGEPEAPRRRRHVGQAILLAAAVLTLGACDSPSPLTINAGSSLGGVTPVSQAAIYSYTVVVTPVFASPSGCGNGYVTCATTDGCMGTLLRLSSDTGVVDWLRSAGSIYLTPGNWTGQTGTTNGAQFYPESCVWTLALTATSASP
jgi:hypothetical protein